MIAKILVFIINISIVLLNLVLFPYFLIIKIVYFKEILRIRVIKNRHKGQRALILLNGPSLKKNNPIINDYDVVFASNKFIEKVDDKELKDSLSYYFIFDEAYLKGDDGNWLQNTITNNDMIFFTSTRFNKYLKKNNKLYYLYDYKYRSIYSKILFLSNLLDSKFHNVAAYMISIAIYMGFNQIDIYGFDFNDMGNHFYEETTKEKKSKAKLLISLFQYFLAQNEFIWLDKVTASKKIILTIINEESRVIAFNKKGASNG